MKQAIRINCVCISLLFSFSVQSKDVGELFDTLMGKYTNPWFDKCITNKSPEPWVSNSKHAYYTSRCLFENYSIEKEDSSSNQWKTPPIIHQIWLGGLVPEKYAAWIATWQKHHPNWTIIMWMDHDLPFLHLVNKDLLEKAKNYGEKSDILRIELLNTFGGLYIDTDCECLQPFDPFNRSNSFYISSVGVGVCGIGVNNAVIGAAQAHPLIQKILYGMKSARKKRILSERTGPMYISRIFFENVRAFQDNVVMYPAQYFESGHNARDDKRTYSIHWFDASWLRPQGLANKIPYDATLEKVLTPRYFSLTAAMTRESVSSPELEEICKHLTHRTIIELGACTFLMNAPIPCDDLKYIGISPVKFLVLDQRLLYLNHDNRVYWWKNWLQETIPHSGLLIMGNVLEYLPYNDCLTLLHNVAESNPEFFMIAHDACSANRETARGQPRALNMCKEPFNFPEPDIIVTIQSKTYGIWKKENR